MAHPDAPTAKRTGQGRYRVKHLGFATLLLLAAWPIAPVSATPLIGRLQLARTNRKLCGHVIDHTHNHGRDCRIWSAALQEKRDLYVYVPPGYDPCKRYPVMLFLHGFGQDEHSFLRDVVGYIDDAIVAGQLPPMVVAAPDGSLQGRGRLLDPGSFYLNSRAGRFEDYLMQDVWNFVLQNYSIRPEREAHAIVGVSMGGGAAFNLAIKYRDRFKVVLGVYPPLNTRWVDCHGRYRANFDPCCWGWREDVSRGWEVVGRFYLVFVFRLRHLLDPIYDRKEPHTITEMSRENPIEMIDSYHLREGDLSMYVCYGRFDQFNIDAQVESFLYRARERGLTVDVGYDPHGHHDLRTAKRLLPGIIDWLGARLRPYGP